MRQILWITALAFGLLAAGFAAAEPRVDAVQSKLPEPARKALDQIPEQGRKLLALRSYLRSAKSLEARWSWSQAEIEAYKLSDQYVSAMAAVAAVTRAFEVKNPGYTLHVNTEVRSLEEQLAKWNSNDSVKAAGTEIDTATTKWLADNPKAEPDALRAFLVDFRPASTSMLAAPGLTNHGRGEAIDFQIAKGGAVIVGAGSSGRWESDGWTARLKEAVRLSMMPFEGPLKDPNEPWHYDYNPPERSKLVASAPWPSPVGPAQDPATTMAYAGEDDAAPPPVIGAVPVPSPRPDAPPAASVKEAQADPVAPASAEAEKVKQEEAAGQKEAKPAPAAVKKVAKKSSKATAKKRVKRSKARKPKKRWSLPF